MTDAQLSVLLYQYSARLSAMLDAAEDALPDEAKIGYRHTTLSPPYHETRLRCDALDDLRAFAQELKQDSELLEVTARGANATAAESGT